MASLSPYSPFWTQRAQYPLNKEIVPSIIGAPHLIIWFKVYIPLFKGGYLGLSGDLPGLAAGPKPAQAGPGSRLRGSLSGAFPRLFPSENAVEPVAARLRLFRPELR